MMNSTSRILAGVGAAWLIAAHGGSALAQSQPPAPDPVLKGPSVHDESIPGEKRRFAPGGGKGKEARDDRANPRLFMQAVRSLDSERTPPDARLTDEQDAKIKDINRGFMDSVRAYMDDHRDEMKELRSKLSPETLAKIEGRLRGAGLGPPPGGGERGPGPKGKKGKNPPPPEEMDGPSGGKPAPRADDPAAKQKLADLVEGAPKFKETQAQIWGVLTEKQRPIVTNEMKRLEEQREKGAGPGRPGEDGKPDLDRAPEKIRERLRNMTPEQREEFMRRRDENRGKKRPPADRGDKPPPPMDDVDVPPPPADAPPPPR